MATLGRRQRQTVSMTTLETSHVSNCGVGAVRSIPGGGSLRPPAADASPSCSWHQFYFFSEFQKYFNVLKLSLSYNYYKWKTYSYYIISIHSEGLRFNERLIIQCKFGLQLILVVVTTVNEQSKIKLFNFFDNVSIIALLSDMEFLS